MNPGDVEVLNREAFDRVFSGEGDIESRKQAAVVLGERCGCKVLFVGTERFFVRFTRRQDVGPFKRLGIDS